VNYNRALLIAILDVHKRETDTACVCGWTELPSHSEHIVDRYEAGMGLGFAPKAG